MAKPSTCKAQIVVDGFTYICDLYVGHISEKHVCRLTGHFYEWREDNDSGPKEIGSN